MSLIELIIASPVQLVNNLISDWYGPDCFLKNIFMWVFLALALFEYGRLLRARGKSGKPDAPQDTTEP